MTPTPLALAHAIWLPSGDHAYRRPQYAYMPSELGEMISSTASISPVSGSSCITNRSLNATLGKEKPGGKRDEFEFFIRKQDGRPRDVAWQWRPASDPYKEGNDVWSMPAPVYREFCNRLRIKRQWR